MDSVSNEPQITGEAIIASQKESKLTNLVNSFEIAGYICFGLSILLPATIIIFGMSFHKNKHNKGGDSP